MKVDPDVGTVVYNDLPMQRTGINALYCDDDGAIIDWLSRYDYPRQILTQDGTATVVVHRAGELDLILVNNELGPGGKGLTVQVWLDFIGHHTDLRKLDKPYNATNKNHYDDIWNHIELQVRRLAVRHQLPPISFSVMDDGQHKPHFRYE